MRFLLILFLSIGPLWAEETRPEPHVFEAARDTESAAEAVTPAAFVMEEAVREAAATPTLGAWSLSWLLAVLAGTAVLMSRRRRVSTGG